MDPMIVSAQFAAYVWYQRYVPKSFEADAVSFAKENWPDFFSLAHEGLGCLLARLAAKRSEKLYPLKLAKLKTLTRALRKQNRSQAE